MKRTKKASGSSRGGSSEGSLGFNPPTSNVPEWEKVVNEKPEESFIPYTLARGFVRNDLLLHKTFGKGVVLATDGARIEVLFAEGVKKLAHSPS
ncbi:MAG: hypothetical protein HY909_13160 [Deltaproteobacteria bacterium]|nr:hypothetical protein [Deltaproteobacteria bacterium]